MCDYEKNLQIIESLERNFNFDPELQESLQRVKAAYERDFISMFTELKDAYWEQGVDYAIGQFDKIFDCSVMGVVKYIGIGIDMIGALTGMSEEADATMYFLDNGINEIEIGTTCFKNAYERLKECSTDSPEYQTCLDDFKNCFEVYKKSYENVYRKMHESCNGSQSNYYLYCAEQYSRLTIQNYEDFELLTFDEFMAL